MADYQVQSNPFLEMLLKVNQQLESARQANLQQSGENERLVKGKQLDLENKKAEQQNQQDLLSKGVKERAQMAEDYKSRHPQDDISITAEGARIGRDFNPYTAQRFQDNGLAKDRAEVEKTIKNLGITDMTKRVNAINSSLTNLSLNSNLGDNAAQLQETMALLGPSGSRALGVVLRQKGIIAPTGDQSLNSIINYVKGSQDPSLNQKTQEAMVDFLKSQKDQVAQQYGSVKNRLAAGLPTIAPHYASANLDVNPLIATYTGDIEDAFKQTDDLYNKFKTPPQVTQPFQQPQARSAADSIKQGAGNMWDKLKSFIPHTAPAQPAPQMQGLPIPGAPPAQPQSSGDPIADEMKKRGLIQ